MGNTLAGKPSALVADDDEAVLRVHARALEREGFHVEMAADGAAAALAVQRHPFDVIVSDIDMPGMSGIELLELVRTRDPDVPVILVTGGPSVATAAKAIELGALRYLVKPVGLEQLLRAVEDAVKAHRVATLRRQSGLLLGDKVDGRYEIRRDLGRGAWGVVFEAVHVFTGRSVALKVVSPDVPASQRQELHARLVREARALAAVRHPGVVEVLDGGILGDGTPFLVMERLDGRTLESLLAARGKLSSDETVALALQACAALDSVHHAGVIHRDLKPGNLLLIRDRDGHERLKLVDFGIAQLNDAGEEKITSVGAVIGTAAYMSYEQLCGLPDVDGRADLYSLGVTMFECLTGDVPYRGPYPRIIMQVGADGPPPALPDDVDPRLARIVARAIAKKREDRFPSAEEFARSLRREFPELGARTALLAPTLVRATPDGFVAERRRFSRAAYATPVHILLPDGTIDGRSEDISEGGLLVVCNEGCERDLRVGVRLALPIEGRVVSCDAVVRWVAALHAHRPDGPRVLGLQFVDMPDALRASVKQYVSLMGDAETQTHHAL